MSRRPDWAAYEPTPEQRETALVSLIERGDEFLDFTVAQEAS